MDSGLDVRRYVINDEIVARHVSDEETVVLDLRSERYYGLNSTSSRIWKRLETGGSLDLLTDELAKESGADLGMVVTDTEDLLGDLVEAGLIQVGRDGDD